MARVRITEAALGVDSDRFVKALHGASVQVNVHGGSAATVYANESGGATLANPLTSSNGRISGWLEEGSYDLVVTQGGDSTTVPFEARAAYPSGGSTGDVLSRASGGGVEWTAPTAITAGLPWQIDILGMLTPATQTNWSTQTTNSAQYLGGYISSDGTQDAEIGWDVVLAAGDWNLYVLAIENNDNGIITASLDGASVGTIDQYGASLTLNVVQSVTGITVSTTGKKRLLFKMSTKNGSSSSYHGRVGAVRLRRTS